jgi:hypothetical protein
MLSAHSIKTILASTLTALCALGLQAATPEHLAKINKFFELTQMQELYDSTLTVGLCGLPADAELKDVPPADRARLEKTLQRGKDLVLGELGWAKVKADMTELYARQFTEAEMDQILKLLDDEPGRRLYRKQLALLPGALASARKKVEELRPRMMTVMVEAGLEKGQAETPAFKRAQAIQCMNNLKQVGLAFRLWEVDHQNRFPFQASTNDGGTLELCHRQSDGSDSAALHHFQVLSNELGTPKLLVCPADSRARVAQNFPTLQATNLSYLLFTGPGVNLTDPDSILARCPIHGHVLHCSGMVDPGKQIP